jgi:hypothetical protein
MLRFSIRDIFWLTAVVGLAIVWGASVQSWREERAGHAVAKAALEAQRAHSAMLERQLDDTRVRLSRITSAYIQAQHAHDKARDDMQAAHQQELERLKRRLTNPLHDRHALETRMPADIQRAVQ